MGACISIKKKQEVPVEKERITQAQIDQLLSENSFGEVH